MDRESTLMQDLYLQRTKQHRTTGGKCTFGSGINLCISFTHEPVCCILHMCDNRLFVVNWTSTIWQGDNRRLDNAFGGMYLKGIIIPVFFLKSLNGIQTL
jgi:hypothetical protein